MLELKPVIFRHILRLNVKCKRTTVQRFRKALETENSKFDIEEKVLDAFWLSDYVIYVAGKESLQPAFQRLAKKFRIDMYFSYVEDSMIDVEYSCGIGRVGKKNDMIKLPSNMLHRFAFGTILLNEQYLTFNAWESNTVKGDVDKYYHEHFIQQDTRKKVEKAFNGKSANLANMMVETRLGADLSWNEVTKYFKAQFKD